MNVTLKQTQKVKWTADRSTTAYSIAKSWLDSSEKHLTSESVGTQGIDSLSSQFDELYDEAVYNHDAEEAYSEEAWKNYEGPVVRSAILNGAKFRVKQLLKRGEYPTTLAYILKNFSK